VLKNEAQIFDLSLVRLTVLLSKTPKWCFWG